VRQADAVDVLDARTHDRLRTVPVGSRPDLFDLSPSGRYAFISLRGKAVTGDPHALTGEESGFTVLDTQTWRVVAKVRTEGANSDIHGIATRPSGFWDWYRARR
jgi:DNA-binding beta-propeller fold protein YncE